MNLLPHKNGTPMARLAQATRPATVRRLLGVGLLAVILLVVLFLPIRLPYAVTAPGQVLPAREWLLVRDAAGRITSVLIDHTLGSTQEYSIAQFERQDAMRFALNERLRFAETVAAGDTLGAVFSSQTERQLARLQGELLTEEAKLRFFTTGEKASVIEEAEQRVQQALARVEAQQRIVDRLRTLAASGAAAAEDLEVAESQLVVYETDVEIARAALQTARTGAKPEQINLIEAGIEALQSEISALERRVDDYFMVSPISGVVLRPGSQDTMLVVADLSELVVVMPVLWSEHRLIEDGQPVEVAGQGFETLEARVYRVDRYARMVDGRQVVFTTALVDDPDVEAVLPGALAQCRIGVGRFTPWELVTRFTTSVVQS